MEIGQIIGGALKLGSQIIGGIKQRKAAKRMNANLNKLEKANNDWYNRRYNEDATQRADAQRLINMTEESIRNRNQQAAGAAAVMGGDVGLASAMAKEANNEALSNTISNIAASADARKDAIENQYMARQDSITAGRNAIEEENMRQIAEATKQVGETAGNIGSSFYDALKKK